jgi:two-component system chemotaxis sensor kinase CheA
LQDIRQRLLATFQVEHRDHVEHIRSLLALMAGTGAPPAETHLEEVFRRAHTLKGAARVVELRAVEQLAHRLETLFARVRQGEIPLSKEIIDLVQRALDAAEDSVAAMGEGRSPAPFTPVLQAIDRTLGVDPEPAPVPEPAAPVPAFQPLETVRVNAQNFDGLLRSAVELLAESQRQAQVTADLKRIAHQAAGLQTGAGLDHPLQHNLRLLSKQINAVSRLQQQSAWTMTSLGKQLQRDVWQARMLPAETLFEGYRKMMRDLAREEGKQIDFEAASTGEHADRRVLDGLKDPLMHVLRNAVSHGIESPRDRTEKGKPAAGTVTLTISGDAQRLKIIVEDDGRGMDIAKILETAVRRKLLSAAEAARCSPQDAARLLFKPGFSTAPAITNLSGRGMGLSVVQEAVQQLQGEVDVQPRPGGGLSFRLSVPVSIATHRLLIVLTSGQPFALPVFWIERVQRIPLAAIQRLEGAPAILLEESAVPLFTLAHLLDLPALADKADRDSKNIQVVILRSGGQRTAVAVDALMRHTEAVIQDLGAGHLAGGKVSGGITLDDGSVALVLNPAVLVEHSAAAKPMELAAETAEKLAPSILVVDDSITTRTLEKSILEAHGYRVRIAVDGQEALTLLRAEKADLVISDVQMPRLDGFGLLEAIKKDKNLLDIPVILVTSLERREDQERGLGLGADAYIVKRKFDQADLLSAIRQIL